MDGACLGCHALLSASVLCYAVALAHAVSSRSSWKCGCADCNAPCHLCLSCCRLLHGYNSRLRCMPAVISGSGALAGRAHGETKTLMDCDDQRCVLVRPSSTSHVSSLHHGHMILHAHAHAHAQCSAVPDCAGGYSIRQQCSGTAQCLPPSPPAPSGAVEATGVDQRGQCAGDAPLRWRSGVDAHQPL